MESVGSTVYGVWLKLWTERVFREGSDRSQLSAGRAAPPPEEQGAGHEPCSIEDRIKIHPRVRRQCVPSVLATCALPALAAGALCSSRMQ